jgi:serine-type D-Ala-D-Ala carboxypeptidase (penicillin-binding protein 5/6)
VRSVALLVALTAVLLVPAATAGPAPLVHQDGPLPAHGIKVTARSAILIDAGDGTVLWGKHVHVRHPIASTTKIMTAIVAMARLRAHDVVTIDRSVRRVAPIVEGLRPGEKVEAWKLFYGALLYSGNDTALALAIGAGGTRPNFVKLMNAKAQELGMHDSHFRSPSGLIDVDNYSTAWDMAMLARFAMWNPRFRAVVRTRVKHVPWSAPTYEKIYVNKNHLIGEYPGANGVKTGWTTLAKHCLVASVKRDGVWLIAVILGADDMYADAKKLFAYGFATRG